MNLEKSIKNTYEIALKSAQPETLGKFYDIALQSEFCAINEAPEDLMHELLKIKENEGYFNIAELLLELVRLIGEEK